MAGSACSLRFLVIGYVAWLVSACSAIEVLYGQADRLLSYALDEYFDLSDAQQDFVDRWLADLIAWHRREELPDYARFLTDAKHRLERGLAAEDLVWFARGAERRYRHLAEHISADAATLLAGVADSQVQRCREALAERNEAWGLDWHLHEPAEERLLWRTSRVLDVAEDWLGPLERRQREGLIRAVEAIPDGVRLRYEDRLRRQREFLALLAERRGADFGLKLRAWLLHWEQGRAPEYQRQLADLQRQASAALLDLDRSLTSAQRDHIAVRLQNLIAPLLALSAR